VKVFQGLKLINEELKDIKKNHAKIAFIYY